MNQINNGDIFQIGEHIVACGDCRNTDFVNSVIGKHKIRAVLTDPPYGVAYVENKKGICKLGSDSEKVITNDHLQSDDEYIFFTKEWLSPVIPYLAEYNTCYIFNCDMMFPALRSGMKQAGFYYSQMIIWVKNQPVMNRKDYLAMHELIAYGWYGKHKMERSKGKSVIYHPKPSSSRLHPTQKPIGLLRKILPNATKIHDYVYDPFLGSGSTAIACEHLGRRCIGIEIDPQYVEIIIKRLEKLTDKKVVKL
jgi:site-specific DNA-methyltransferase (adenine-specific)